MTLGFYNIQSAIGFTLVLSMGNCCGAFLDVVIDGLMII
jgi:hypothetical protein